eukprot:CAMPEP_0179202824 /NCGR_PEP_ID=MMETSP0796-20121207/101054_1 /TAXON_ID=73915 /ORGANISM="Pyrodinium bahamense, Strain pbaha01" /LENGTH=219 /DNA_ID=CAMNT_0020907597 /DNA_START=58 /DNA_END=716 /DNA_ORIENTATION=-
MLQVRRRKLNTAIKQTVHGKLNTAIKQSVHSKLGFFLKFPTAWNKLRKIRRARQSVIELTAEAVHQCEPNPVSCSPAIQNCKGQQCHLRENRVTWNHICLARTVLQRKADASHTRKQPAMGKAPQDSVKPHSSGFPMSVLLRMCCIIPHTDITAGSCSPCEEAQVLLVSEQLTPRSLLSAEAIACSLAAWKLSHGGGPMPRDAKTSGRLLIGGKSIPRV